MMMATCARRRRTPAFGNGGGDFGLGIDMAAQPSPLDREDFLFLGRQHLVDLGDRLIGRLLHLLGACACARPR